MVVQGVCPAPKGIAVRNAMNNALWQTHPINLNVPTGEAPKNTGWKFVTATAYRDPKVNTHLTNGRSRSIAAYNRQWKPALDITQEDLDTGLKANSFCSTEWPSDLSVNKVQRYRSTLTSLRSREVLSRTSEWHRCVPPQHRRGN